MYNKTNSFLAAILGIFLAVALPNVALAQTTFTVTPTAVGEPEAPFNATFITFTYNALIDQTAVLGTGSFSEQGFLQYTAFTDAAKNPLNAILTGLNATYNMYAVFTGSGTVAPDLISGGTIATFTDFSVKIYVDPSINTTFANLATLVDVPDDDGANVNSPNPFVTGGTGEDVLVGQSTGFVSGQAHAFGSQAQGDFDIVVDFAPVGGFFSLPFSLHFTVTNASGNNDNVTLPAGASGLGTFTDAHFRGAGLENFSAAGVPEPSSLLLIGSGLIGIVIMIRRRTEKKQ